MFTRLTTFQADKTKLDALEKSMSAVREQLKTVSGLVSCYSSWAANGSGCVVAVYESKDLAEAGAEKARVIWGSLASMLTAPPSTSVFENVADLKG
jgi:hypothetical protein